MALAESKPIARAGVSFALDRMEQSDHQIVIVGCWSGVRGMRFVRPALIVGAKQVLATLEHKPWAPSADPWQAVFPWTSGPITRAEAVLAVAPSIEVWLATGRARVPALPASARSSAAPAAVLASAPAFAVLPERSAPAPEAGAASSPLQPAADLRADVRELSGELERARCAAERERALSAAQHDEAVRDREAAVRARARMEIERDAATAARKDLGVERDAALAQLVEVRAQRDEVIVAHRALERRFDQRAGTDAPDAAVEPSHAASASGPHAEEEPLGVRAVPVGRTIAAGAHRADVDARPRATTLDLWAIRVCATITAACLLGLLVLLLGVIV